MRHFLVATLSMILFTAAQGRADEQADARAVLDKVIKASGGEAKLGQLKTLTWKSRATVEVNGNPLASSGDWSVQGNDKYHWSGETDINGNLVPFNLTLNGTQGWLQGNNSKANELPKDVSAFLAREFQAIRFTEQLLPLTGKDVNLSSLGELIINGRNAVGIKATRKDLPDLDLFFDKETMLPLKTEIRAKEPTPEGQEATHAFYFGSYKEVEGVQHFTKLTFERDGKKVLEMEWSDIKPQESLDSSLFEKP